MSNRRFGFKIFKRGNFDDLSVRVAEEVPVIDIADFKYPAMGGLLYEPTSQRLYFGTGTQWIPVGGGGVGTVTSVAAGVGLNALPFNPITTAGTINLADTTVIPGTYGDATHIPQYTVDQQGRLTFSTNIPISSSTGTSKTFSLIKSGNQIVLPNVFTILTGWSIAPNPPYHDNTTNWALVGGIFTATGNVALIINVDISWLGGVSNLGNRTLRVIYQPFLGVPFVAKEAITQADPNTAVDTTQEACTCLLMSAGDEAWIEVRHTAPVNLTVSAGNTTTISGSEVTV